MSKTAPSPILRALDQPALNRITVNTTKLLHEFAVVPDIEVIIAFQPKRIGSSQSQPPRNSLFQRLYSLCQRSALGFAYQQMHMLRHNNIAVYADPILLSNALQCIFEGTARLWSSEIWSTFVTTESEEVEVPRLLEAFQSPRHGDRIFRKPRSSL
jgi:hypothetical protein